MPRVQAPLKKANARSWASNTISWRLARIGPHERHPAVAEPDMRDLHGRRHAVDHDDLVAPVELVGLARREAQRHDRPPPSPAFSRRRQVGRIAPHRVVAALVAEAAQLLEHPDQRQPLAPRPRRVRRQQPVQLAPPRPDLRLRLHARARSVNSVAPDRSTFRTVFRDTRSSRQICLDRLLALNKYARRIFAIVSTTSIPNPAPDDPREHSWTTVSEGVPFGRRSPR